MASVIIAGDRNETDLVLVARAIACAQSCGLQISEVVSGGARGVDTLGESWAVQRGIPVRRFPADWRIGRGAGPRRNRQMADYADALIAVHRDLARSRGTDNMIAQARRAGLRVFVYDGLEMREG